MRQDTFMQFLLKANKIIGVNLLFIFFIIGLFAAGPSLIFKLYLTCKSVVEPLPSKFAEEIRKNYPWYEIHEDELHKVGAGYKDFVVMQHPQFAGETINIDENGVRYTKQPGTINDNDVRYLFFGASIIWGYGATDALTIPSIFGEINHAKSFNYALSAAGSRQLFAILANLYIENKIERDKKNIIIFNSGPMNAQILLKRNKIELATTAQDKIQNALTYSPFPLSPAFILMPATEMVHKIRLKLNKPKEISSTKFNGAYKEAIEFAADLTIRVWLLGEKLTSTFGDDFIAVFPPVSAIGHPYIKHLSVTYTEEDAKFMGLVYKKILEKVKAYPEIKFIDLTTIFDGDEPIYIDRWHYSPKGNRIYAQELTKQIQKLTIQSRSRKSTSEAS